jgi:hypothetical protein
MKKLVVFLLLTAFFSACTKDKQFEEKTLTGIWRLTEGQIEVDLTIIQHDNNTLSGTFDYINYGNDTGELLPESNISENIITFAFIQNGYSKLVYTGDVNTDFDYMSGEYTIDGRSWYSYIWTAQKISK